jgi:hopanoid biosynthesis associated radical SAM protein HpnH
LDLFHPSPYLCFNVHLDGLAETHDAIVCREGIFDKAIEGITAAKGAGFQVVTNTTVYKQTDPQEIRNLFELLMDKGIDGLLVAPAFNYEAVADDALFLSREDVTKQFQTILSSPNGFRFYNTPLYLDFLKGERDYECTAWGNPTRNPQGWKSPCYLITDAHYESFEEMMAETPWENYGVGKDPRCQNCMMHCGFEPTAVLEVGNDLRGLWKTAKWALS